MTLLDDQRWASMATSLDARTEGRHRWYWVKEGFSPLLVQAAVHTEGCSRGDLIVDPFCGSGTVPVEAARCQIPSAGAEVNPFLAFVANAKTLSPQVPLIVAWSESAKKHIYKGTFSPLRDFSTFANSRDKRGLFNSEILMGFQSAWQSLESAPPETMAVLRLCLLRSALDCANFTRDGKALRYSETLIKRDFKRVDLEAAFCNRVEEAIEDVEGDKVALTGPHIELTDSRTHLSGRFQGFKLCVTSPPYLNSFDYTDIYRPELFLGGFIRSASALRRLRHRTVRSHVQASWRLPVDSDFGPLFVECFEAIRAERDKLWDKRIPEMVQAYFEDLRAVLRSLRSLARPDAAVWLVVSTSAYAGVSVPVDLITAHIGTQVGWSIREVSVLRHHRSSGQHQRRLSSMGNQTVSPLRESLVILDANPK